ncbi:MAG: F0F1 ATP synthase subunit A [Reichenbachiella sp.]|uniref:F0F1 ATP synthase subunit A n=1 Tax=Reichenbachiella sp. TaxID=2184521 RepID=UPI00326375A2
MTTSKHLKISILLMVFGLFVSQTSFAGETKEGEKFDPSVMINHHIMDAHDWHLFDLKDDSGVEHPVSIPLPVILWDNGLHVFMSSQFHHGQNVVESNGNYYFNAHEHIYKTDADGTLEYDEKGGISNAHPIDLSITKNVAMLFINALVMVLIFMSVARGYKKNVKRAPRGIQSFFEPIIIYVRDEIVKPNIGPKYEKYLPYLLTLFFFVWFGNLLGLLPAAANLTGNIAVTMTLSVLTLVITLASGRKTYWLHILDPLGNSMPWLAKLPLYLILWPIEIIGIFTKPFSLMVRLFANITAGHIIILSIISLTFITQSLVVGVASTAFATVMNMLELFVALLQAYVFTLLTSMYFGQAVEEHH